MCLACICTDGMRKISGICRSKSRTHRGQRLVRGVGDGEGADLLAGAADLEAHPPQQRRHIHTCKTSGTGCPEFPVWYRRRHVTALDLRQQAVSELAAFAVLCCAASAVARLGWSRLTRHLS